MTYDEAKALCMELMPKKGDSYWYGQSGVVLFVFAADSKRVYLTWATDRSEQTKSSIDMPLAGFWHRLTTKLFHNEAQLCGKQGYVRPAHALVYMVGDDLRRGQS